MVRTGDNPARPVLELHSYRAPELFAVRRWATECLPGMGSSHLSDVLLVVTELVTNVYDHTPGAGRLHVARLQDPCRVVVEVDDRSPDSPTVGRSRLSEDRGRGVTLVAALSQSWGVRPRDEGGKTVWAVVGCDGDSADCAEAHPA